VKHRQSSIVVMVHAYSLCPMPFAPCSLVSGFGLRSGSIALSLFSIFPFSYSLRHAPCPLLPAHFDKLSASPCFLLPALSPMLRRSNLISRWFLFSFCGVCLFPDLRMCNRYSGSIRTGNTCNRCSRRRWFLCRLPQ